eukprot:CAMPEP_0198250028 /NCGR_PEP_ID=MMETSP1447-20131203/1361_1 /TAXON_ID=420782 /ORGANISM="Chaetoceros dichaeta, Strain CCMP1751" /LENGTH=168 /DNA_ID=CAMNT_0043934789 /DNA_START=53 /DNA_END=559 /DNA_ORIENTATION=+
MPSSTIKRTLLCSCLMVTSSNAFLSMQAQRQGDIGLGTSNSQRTLPLTVSSGSSVPFITGSDGDANPTTFRATALRYKNSENDDEYTSNEVSLEAISNLAVKGDIDAIDLPKSFMQRTDTGLEDALSLENSIGRLAMVCTVLFFGKELVSNLSIADQISAVLKTFPIY